MTEKEIEKDILDWLNCQLGTFAFKVNTGGIYDSKRKIFRTIKNPHIHKGTSDILGVCRGKFFAIEVKTPRAHGQAIKHPTERDRNQENFLRLVMDSGGFSIRVSTLEQVMKFMSGIP